MSKAQFIIMGCGNSSGTPSVGNYWGNCDPTEPRNRRTRAAALVRSASTTLVIDTGPDFREQANRAEITHPDAVLYTHSHGDHIHGIDDLRPFRLRNKRRIDIYANDYSMMELRERFGYLFTEKHGIYPEVLTPHIWQKDDYGRKHIIGDIEFTPFIQDHGTCESVGFRFGDVAYSTDLVDLSPESIHTLQGIKIWVVDAAGYKMPENQVHLTLRSLYALNEKVMAPQIYITHLSSQMDYQTLCRELPEGYAPAYDGLTLDI